MSPRGRSKPPKPKSDGSLLSPEGMGGIVAGGGFDFQSRYAVCHLPEWIQTDFKQLLFEGTGDIDLRFGEGAVSTRRHIQVKDHEVGASELRTAVDHFVRLDAKMPNVYQTFTLVCPSLSPKLRPVEAGLARLRGAKAYYDSIPAALGPTRDDLHERFRRNGLEKHATFLEAKVFLEVVHGDLKKDEHALALFVDRMLRHPDYARKFHSMVAPAYAELLRAVSAHRGKVLDRAAVEAIFRQSIRPDEPDPNGVTLWLQNWTNEKFEIAPDYALDWSKYFDRASRRVPSPEEWNDVLLPELRRLHARILRERSERLIRFRGKCALSSGIALGAIFPAVGGWRFEIPQPPSRENWKSDDNPSAPYDLRTELLDGDAQATDLVLGLNIKGNARDAVLDYLQGAHIGHRVVLFAAPPSQGGSAIKGSEEACAFALAIRGPLDEVLKTHSIRRTHIFYYGPFALAVFLGQYLTAIGDVQLYEYQDPGYVASCRFST